MSVEHRRWLRWADKPGVIGCRAGRRRGFAWQVDVVVEAQVRASSPWISSERARQPQMNEFGQVASTYWTKWLPSRLARIPEGQREAFFADLGDRAQEQVSSLEEKLEAQTDLSDLGYLEKVGRLNAIRAQARESVMAELIYLEPEQETEQSPEAPDHPLSEWMDPQGMPRDRSHRLWRMLEDEETSTEEFRAASGAWEDSLWAKIEAARGGVAPDGSRPTT